MKILTRVRIIVALPVALGLGVIAVQVWSIDERNKALARHELANRLVQSMAELDHLTGSFLLHPREKRPVRQWWNKHNGLHALLSEHRVEQVVNTETLKRLHLKHSDLSQLFQKIVGLHFNPDTELTRERTARVMEQLQATVQEMATDVLHVRKVITADVIAVHDFAWLLILAFSLALLTATWATAQVMGRQIIARLTLVRQGTERIGSGDLDYRLNLQGDDEIADLGQSFDRMVEQLQANRASGGRPIDGTAGTGQDADPENAEEET